MDVVFKSSDGELLGAHSRNLEMYGEGFPAAPNGVADPEPASLTEPAKTLRTLLAFMHLVPQPRIRNLSCKSVLEIAEAAEKYGVHSATQVCAIVLECVELFFQVRGGKHAHLLCKGRRGRSAPRMF